MAATLGVFPSVNVATTTKPNLILILIMTSLKALFIAISSLIIANTGLSLAAGICPPRAEQSFNNGWLFHKGKLDPIKDLAPATTGWEKVNVPHDWAISGPFDPDVPGNQGKLPWQGEGWYQKDFTLTAADLAGNRRVVFLFDGVMANPEVFINGKKAGSWNYGYNAFTVDASDLVHADKPNQIAVHASTLQHYSRWYPGAGIFRKVRMFLTDPVHIPVWGVWIQTPGVTKKMAEIAIYTEVSNETDATAEVEVLTRIMDGASQVGEVRSKQSVPAGGTAKVPQKLTIQSPVLWDVDSPHLYTAVSEIIRDGKTTDYTHTRFGVRSFEWTADDGLHLNGRRVQIHGVCLHHDNGPLGSALFKDSERRKLAIMRDMGVNSIRTSHNPPSPELLDLCDEMGLIVIDELFDKYGATASVDVSTAEFVNKFAEREVRNFIRRDRNHPSILMWSVGNEVPDILGNKDGKAKEHMEKMVSYFHKYDPTRPTNMASHMTVAVNNRSLEPVDTMGWNYGQKYVQAHKKYPAVPQIYTESASAFSTRGFYQFPHPKNRNDFSKQHTETSYDFTSATWSDIADVEFMRMERDRHIAGEYVWTGFDYLGEPTPHTQQARSSYFGIVDLVGLPKDRYYKYKSYWNTLDHTLHILPHWTWPDRVGKNVPVYVYTDGDEAELFLNGQSLGRRKKAGADSASSTNLAFNKPAKASSEEIEQDKGGNVIKENRPDKAVDGASDSRWCAAGQKTPHWLQVDLGRKSPIGYVAIDWEREAAIYTYKLEVSDDERNWKSVGSSGDDKKAGIRSILKPGVSARYLRVFISKVKGNSWPSITELQVESEVPKVEPVRNPYYRIVDRYRLRWEDVIYQPGELKVVAYKDGARIGEQTVRTAGKPAAIHLTPETTEMSATGDTLTYVVVEAVDSEGNLCPRDMSMVDFKIEGPATIAGIGNGDPLSLDPFQDSRHPLFYGKAMLILRSVPDRPGEILIRAKADGMKEGQAKIVATP